MAKRWEFVYEEGSEGVEAVLREQGVGAGPRRSSMAVRQPSMTEVSKPAPVTGVHPDRMGLVPRREDARTSGTGCTALDELFSFTTAKPKLYYKPVSQPVVDRRMDMIKDLRVGHAGMGKSGDEDMKRYSFDVYRGEEEWVDKGPEFGYGRRGVERLTGGGGVRGGFRGRGGRGGGGGFGDRVDSWRAPPRR